MVLFIQKVFSFFIVVAFLYVVPGRGHATHYEVVEKGGGVQLQESHLQEFSAHSVETLCDVEFHYVFLV